MKDLFKQELSIGDTVAFNPPTYKGLAVGEIVGFTPMNVRVKYHSYGKQTSDFTVVHSLNLVKAPSANSSPTP